MAGVRFADLQSRPTEFLDFTSVTLDAYSTDVCHLIHRKVATQSTGSLPPSPRERCHVDHGKVATHSRRSLPLSERSDAGGAFVSLIQLLVSTWLAVSAWILHAK